MTKPQSIKSVTEQSLKNRKLDTEPAPHWRPGYRDFVLFSVIAFFMLGWVRANAQPTDPSTGMLQLQNESGATFEVMAIDSIVKMRIVGGVAEVAVTQQFVNPSVDWVNGQYLFPLPDEAAVNRMTLKIGDRLIEGEIQEKEQARQTFTRARAEGKTASLVTQQRPNLFITDVSNVAPEEAIAVELKYVQPLRFRDSQFSLRYPLTMTPRYGETPPVSADGSIKSSVQMQIALEPGFELVRLESRHHDVKVDQMPWGYQIELLPDQIMSDHAFELVWEPSLKSTPQATAFTQYYDGEEYALLMLMPPQNKNLLIQPRELILVIDSSGSMQGASMDQAKQSLIMAIGSLRPEDHFNIIEFDSVSRSLFESSRPADTLALGSALDYVDSIEADGGTNMAPALEMALSSPPLASHIRQVVFITDGAIGNETQLFEQITTQLQQARLFTVGIGAAPNSYFMRKAAEFGQGSYTYIGSIAEMTEKMDGLLTRLERPVATDLCLDWVAMNETYPAILPDLYAGEPLTVVARLNDQRGDAMLCGKSSGQSWERYIDLNQTQPGDGVATLWARKKIETAMDDLALGADPAVIREQVLDTALRHRLVSRYTSFVAVDQTPWRTAEALADRLNPMDLTNPTNLNSLAVALPQTATDGPLRTILGLMCLALGLIFYRRFQDPL